METSTRHAAIGAGADPGHTSMEVAERLYASFARGDIAEALELLDPDVAWVTPETLPWSDGRYSGRDGVASYFAAFGAALENGRVEPDRMLDAGETVVALGHERATVRSTGRSFEAPFAHVITVRGGRVTALRGHVDTALIAAAFDQAPSA